jgi:hypothetical protein
VVGQVSFDRDPLAIDIDLLGPGATGRVSSEGLQRAARTPGHRGRDRIGVGQLGANPVLAIDVEHGRKGPQTDPGVTADVGIEGDPDPVGLVFLESFLL